MAQISTIIFDLSEVLIAGLIGIENELSARFQIPKETILPTFGGNRLTDLCRGQLSEDTYLASILEQEQWKVTAVELKEIIRNNFAYKISGMEGLVTSLSEEYELVLLSDHGVEWIAYIEAIHPFLADFRHKFYSFDLKQTKQETSTFIKVLELIQRKPEQCLFVDDNPVNILTAEAAGIKGIQFISSEQLVSELQKSGIFK